VRNVWSLLREEPRARPFLIAHAQSSVGNGAAYVALLLLVYERFDSALAVGLVLLADLLPAMVLGPLLGAAADRWGKRDCAIVADLLRVAAFAVLPFMGSLTAMFAVALVAGFGTSLFLPAANAMLPLVVDEERLPAANAYFGACVDAGLALGPLVAAPLLLIAGPESVLLVNAATFAMSALLLLRVPRDRRVAVAAAGEESLLRSAGEGVKIAARLPVVRVVLVAAAAGVLFAAAINVGEVALAVDSLGAGAAGYTVLVAVNSLGTVIGALAASGALAQHRVARRFVAGLAMYGAALVAAGLAGALGGALIAFAAAGFANGFTSTHERTLLQAATPDEARGRVFGVRDALNAWGFGIAFIAGGVVVEQLGASMVFVLAGIGLLAVALGAAGPIRRSSSPASSPRFAPTPSGAA
jgi:MFS family permease